MNQISNENSNQNYLGKKGYTIYKSNLNEKQKKK